MPLIGSQEGDSPIYRCNPQSRRCSAAARSRVSLSCGGVYLAGGEIYPMPLRAEHRYLPVFECIPAAVLARARMMVLSYPHNPTTAIANLAFFEQAVQFWSAAWVSVGP